MDIIISPVGDIRCIYGEAISLRQLGRVSIQRGSYVEPDSSGQWNADLSPVNGPTLGPFATRTQALEAEVQWLGEHWLVPVKPA